MLIEKEIFKSEIIAESKKINISKAIDIVNKKDKSKILSQLDSEDEEE